MLTSIFRRLSGGKNIPVLFYRYILSEISKPFLGAALFFLFVLMMFQVIRLSDFFVVHNVSGYSILSLMSTLMLTFTPVILPIAFLLAVLMGFGRLSSDGEVIAMRSAGMSVYSMLWPTLGMGIVVGMATLICNFYFVPWATREFRYELFRISNTKAIATIHEGTFTEGFFDLVLYADKVNSKDNTLQKVLIYDERDHQLPVTVVANNGKILNNYQDANGIPGLVLRLFNGSLHRSDPKAKSYELTQFSVYDIFLRIETAKVVGVEQPKTMDINSLKEEIIRLAAKTSLNPIETIVLRDYRVEYWKRYALSFSCVIFAILGVAFGVIRTRTVRSNSFLICILVLLLYWVLYSFGYDFASTGRLPAFVGMWISNGVLLLVALRSFWRVTK